MSRTYPISEDCACFACKWPIRVISGRVLGEHGAVAMGYATIERDPHDESGTAWRPHACRRANSETARLIERISEVLIRSPGLSLPTLRLDLEAAEITPEGWIADLSPHGAEIVRMLALSRVREVMPLIPGHEGR